MTISTAAPVLALTPLDERVVAAIERPRRRRWHRLRPATTDEIVRRMYPVSTTSAGATPDQAREVAEILRGLERFDRVHLIDGVWHTGPASSALTKAKRP